jgi:hypothetical protein
VDLENANLVAGNIFHVDHVLSGVFTICRKRFAEYLVLLLCRSFRGSERGQCSALAINFFMAFLLFIDRYNKQHAKGSILSGTPPH